MVYFQSVVCFTLFKLVRFSMQKATANMFLLFGGAATFGVSFCKDFHGIFDSGGTGQVKWVLAESQRSRAQCSTPGRKHPRYPILISLMT